MASNHEAPGELSWIGGRTRATSEQIRTQLVVTLDADSRISEGQEAKLWVDPTRMHLFDPASGENLTHRHSAQPPVLASA